jgi:hypothetical protein
MKYSSYYIEKIVDVIQELEDIGGPPELEQYIAVLTAVKIEIESRIKVACDRIRNDEEGERYE